MTRQEQAIRYVYPHRAQWERHEPPPPGVTQWHPTKILFRGACGLRLGILKNLEYRLCNLDDVLVESYLRFLRANPARHALPPSPSPLPPQGRPLLGIPHPSFAPHHLCANTQPISCQDPAQPTETSIAANLEPGWELDSVQPLKPNAQRGMDGGDWNPMPS